MLVFSILLVFLTTLNIVYWVGLGDSDISGGTKKKETIFYFELGSK